MKCSGQSSSSRHAEGWAFAGLALVFSGPVAYLLFVDNVTMRVTGAPAFGLMAAGSAMGLLGAWRDRRRWVRLICVLNVLLLVGFAYSFIWWAVLPKTPVFASLQTAPDFTLQDHSGQWVTLSEAWSSGPVLLVFYRGHW
ncbi:MAG: redoxin domain-containing protein [Planctomycetes bacterium]|nr:redoxin domain-containing protein [Planctomycetota bacterium]